MLNINQFSARKINKVDDYELFYYSKAYLKKKDNIFKIYFKDTKMLDERINMIKKLAQKCNYTNINNFIKDRKEWQQMKMRIPLKYLKAIDIKLDVLEFTVELDQDNFNRILALPRYPKYISLRLHPKFYKTIELPEHIDEEEAVEMAATIAVEENRDCFIRYENFKMIKIDSRGYISHFDYVPGIEILGDYLYPTLAGIEIDKIF